MGAARFFRRTGEGVYDMDDLARRTEAMANFVAAHVAAHKALHPGVSVYGFGYSNGANILASVAMARPDLFDRIRLLHPILRSRASRAFEAVATCRSSILLANRPAQLEQ
jgi:phospholipase/carboxylesterase